MNSMLFWSTKESKLNQAIIMLTSKLRMIGIDSMINKLVELRSYKYLTTILVAKLMFSSSMQDSLRCIIEKQFVLRQRICLCT